MLPLQKQTSNYRNLTSLANLNGKSSFSFELLSGQFPLQKKSLEMTICANQVLPSIVVDPATTSETEEVVDEARDIIKDDDKLSPNQGSGLRR